MIDPVWDEQRQMFLFYLDGVPEAVLADGSLSVVLASSGDPLDSVGFSAFDASFGSLGDRFITVANVPEPTTLALLALGGLAVARRDRKSVV